MLGRVPWRRDRSRSAPRRLLPERPRSGPPPRSLRLSRPIAPTASPGSSRPPASRQPNVCRPCSAPLRRRRAGDAPRRWSNRAPRAGRRRGAGQGEPARPRPRALPPPPSRPLSQRPARRGGGGFRSTFGARSTRPQPGLRRRCAGAGRPRARLRFPDRGELRPPRRWRTCFAHREPRRSMPGRHGGRGRGPPPRPRARSAVRASRGTGPRWAGASAACAASLPPKPARRPRTARRRPRRSAAPPFISDTAGYRVPGRPSSACRGCARRSEDQDPLWPWHRGLRSKNRPPRLRESWGKRAGRGRPAGAIGRTGRPRRSTGRSARRRDPFSAYLGRGRRSRRPCGLVPLQPCRWPRRRPRRAGAADGIFRRHSGWTRRLPPPRSRCGLPGAR